MLQDVIRQLPKHNVIIIIPGDMNSQVGSEDMVGFSSHDKTNRNGHLLLDLAKIIEIHKKSTTRLYHHQQEVEKLQWTASLTTQCALYSLIIGPALPQSVYRKEPAKCRRQRKFHMTVETTNGHRSKK